MRTTIDLPDDLLRRLKVRAALDGVTLKDLVTRYVTDGLAQGKRMEASEIAPPVRPRRSDLPVMVPTRGRRLEALTNAEVQALLDREDAAHIVTVPDHRE